MAKAYEKGSIAHFADIGLSRISKLAKSSLLSEKFAGMNILLFSLVLAVLLTTQYTARTPDFLPGILTFIVFLLLSLIISIGYGKVLDILVSFTTNKICYLRYTITILLVALTASIGFFVFRNAFLLPVAVILIGLQMILPFFISIFSLTPVEDVKIEESRF